MQQVGPRGDEKHPSGEKGCGEEQIPDHRHGRGGRDTEKQESRRDAECQHQSIADAIAAPVGFPPGEEDAHDSEAATKADQRTGFAGVESGAAY